MFCLLFFVVYAFGESYAVLFLARSIHGIGSSCAAIAGKWQVEFFCLIKMWCVLRWKMLKVHLKKGRDRKKSCKERNDVKHKFEKIERKEGKEN